LYSQKFGLIHSEKLFYWIANWKGKAMVKIFSMILAALFLVSCEGLEIPDQTSRAYWDERCKFDGDTWEEYEIGSPDHQMCIEMLESGIDPDEDFADGDSGDND